MAVSAIESRQQFQLLIWYGVGAFALLLIAMLLAADLYLVAVLLVGMGWMITLPYHARLSVILATATFSSAFIVPFAPGRPYAWEAAAMLGWSGIVVLILLRRFPEGLAATIRRNRWIFVGAIIYCATLLLIMWERGFGLRIMGSSQMGGRFYIQQLICAILPLLFAMIRIEEKLFVRLLFIQWMLSATFFVSDFAFTFGGASNLLLAFFEVPGDAVNFENLNSRFGIRRFQSFSNAGLGLVFVLLARYHLREFFGRRIWWLLPLAAVVFGVSLLSGHRGFVFYVGGTVLVLAYAQRFFTSRMLIVAPLVGVLLLLVLYDRADRLPLAAQRAISFLPGIEVNPHAAADAAGTIHLRKVLRHIGIQMIPDHLWVGRGFAKYADVYSLPWDIEGIDRHVMQGVFYNGFIGLLVNTGVTGTLGMLVLIAGGTALAWRVIRLVRRLNAEDSLCRASSLLGGFWVTSVLFFLFLHGDSELAMKSFAMQLGALILAERLLLSRWEAWKLEHQASEAEATPTAEAAPDSENARALA